MELLRRSCGLFGFDAAAQGIDEVDHVRGPRRLLDLGRLARLLGPDQLDDGVLITIFEF